jgi:hypothetical protein
MSGTFKLTTLAALSLAAALSACTSNGNGSGGSSGGGGTSGGDGSIDGSSSSGGPANDGTGSTNITNNGNPVSGNFICTTGARAYGNVTTVVGTDGLVGDSLTSLLNSLGGSTVTQLLNSVVDPNNVIDGKLSTFAIFQLTAGLLSPSIDSVDLSVVMPQGTTVPVGKYAVFGLSFPGGTADIDLLDSITVATSLAGVQQESNTLSQTLLLSLLGASLVPGTPVWLGVQTTKPYDTATLELNPSLLAVTAGDRLHAYEMCVDGTLSTSSSSSGGSSSSSSSSGG